MRSYFSLKKYRCLLHREEDGDNNEPHRSVPTTGLIGRLLTSASVSAGPLFIKYIAFHIEVDTNPFLTC